jgi:hypothetical protein
MFFHKIRKRRSLKSKHKTVSEPVENRQAFLKPHLRLISQSVNRKRTEAGAEHFFSISPELQNWKHWDEL